MVVDLGCVTRNWSNDQDEEWNGTSYPEGSYVSDGNNRHKVGWMLRNGNVHVHADGFCLRWCLMRKRYRTATPFFPWTAIPIIFDVPLVTDSLDLFFLFFSHGFQYQARLRLPDTFSHSQKMQCVDHIIEVLDLSGCQDTSKWNHRRLRSSIFNPFPNPIVGSQFRYRELVFRNFRDLDVCDSW